jgi:hypothetical protein
MVVCRPVEASFANLNRTTKGKYMTDSDAYRTALDVAMTNLIATLSEARRYLYDSDYPLASIGTMTVFADQADDVKAALRLFTNAMRRKA